MRGSSVLGTCIIIKRFRAHSLFSRVNFKVKGHGHDGSPRHIHKRTFTTKGMDEKVQLTRNVGIMAHIDAGKTTTTERMLYLAGVISHPGEVHHGDTVTDYLPQERERGITIQSAVVGFPWLGCSINLIDTPGHVDFTFEVERSLRVVESAVAVLDASAGVEPQTLTVWRQANDYNLPRIIFLNKMDKSSSSVPICLDSIQSKLKSTPLLLQRPIFDKSSGQSSSSSSGLVGILDIIGLRRLIFDSKSKGARFSVEDLKDDKSLIKLRCELVEQVSDFDSELAVQVIENESLEAIPAVDLHAAIKRVTLANHCVPVLLGSSFKSVGVQPLMDAIIKYLPHPLEFKNKDPVVSSYGSELCSFAFKTIHDRQLGPLTFIRNFSGTLTSGQKVYNVSREKGEKILKLYLPLADDLKETDKLGPGQVGVVSGLKETITGDTLSSSAGTASRAQKVLAEKTKKKDVAPVLTSVQIPEPVFFCSVEPASLSHQKGLDAALECLQREDPSLRVHVDPDTAQTVLSGMGELHLDIIHERLKSDFKVDCDLGKLMVAYKETITEPISHRMKFERRLGDRSHSVEIDLDVLLDPNDPEPFLKKGTSKEAQEVLAPMNERTFRLIQNGIESSLRCGPKLGFPVIHVRFVLNYFSAGKGTSDTIIEAAAAACVRQCLQDSTVILLEPIVRLQITVDEKYQHNVTDDLNRRRFCLQEIDTRHGNKIINGTVPLGELMGYSTTLRTISSGLGTYSMHFSHYEKIDSFAEDKIVQEIRGF